MNTDRHHRPWRTGFAILLACAFLGGPPAAHAADKGKDAAKPAAKKATAKKAPSKPVAKPSTPPLKPLPAPASSATQVGADKAAATKSLAARMQAERQHAESEQVFLRQLQDKLPVGLWSADRVVDETDGNTLLHHAVMQGWSQAARYLLDQGADPESRNILGKTPAILAKELGHGGILTDLGTATAKRAAERAAR
jgi:hypothetical protein